MTRAPAGGRTTPDERRSGRWRASDERPKAAPHRRGRASYTGQANETAIGRRREIYDGAILYYSRM